MYEDDIEATDGDNEEKQRGELSSQLVSIRKKLIEPNNILPAAMIRSQPPRHLLPLPPEPQSRPGHRMPLDPYPQQSNSHSLGALSSRKQLSFHGRQRNYSQLPEFKRKEMIQLNEQDKVQGEEKEGDILSFLGGRIKSLLDFPEQVAFISSSAFVSNVNTNKYKPSTGASASESKQKCLQYLKQSGHFAATTFAFDQLLPTLHHHSSLNFDQNLEFSDDFESSNIFLVSSCDPELMKAFRKPVQKYQSIYFLTVRLDYNTRSYGQWFYFRVRRRARSFSLGRSNNTLSYKFMIINMTKNSSLFGKGLKVSVCRNGTWGKEGDNIRYYRNSLRREEITGSELEIFQIGTEYYHTLEFSLQLDMGQQIYVSYNEPYSYSRVGRLLDKMTAKYEQNQHNIINFKRTELCTTYLNNSIEVLTMSARRNVHPLHLSIDDKKVIFIMARTHPVETAGSHVVQGILNEIYKLFIQSPNQEHRSHILYQLLEQYILKVIPMVNPDGVILGNSRCNLTGYDLNRCWKGPKYDRSKQVYYIKRHIFLYNRRVEMFLDLHAHSKKKNVFAYGCHDISDPYSSREFPYLLSKLSHNDFLFQECRFTRLTDSRQQTSKKASKDGTARVFLYDSLRIPNIFTIENSYCSARNSAYHYDKHSYGVIGADILTAVSLYFSPQFKNEFATDRRERAKEMKQQSAERDRSVNQSHIKISVNSTFANDLELKVTINSEKPRSGTMPIDDQISRCKNPIELRDRYLLELRQKEDNIKIGLQKENEVSESEQEDRIYEPSPKKRVKEKNKTSSDAALRKAQGEAKTDRLLQYLSKNAEKPSPQKTSNKQSVLNVSNISSTHSETNLARITKITKNKFRTLTKPEQLVLIPDEICHQNYSRDTHKLPSRSHRPLTKLQSSRKEKTANCLSIVQIGLGNDVEERQVEERITVIDRFDAKDRLKTFHGFREAKNPHLHMHTEARQEVVHRPQEQKDDEIKEYLRRLMKPKQLVECKGREREKERLVCLQESDRGGQKTKQSHLQFNDMRMSKLMILQNHKQFRLHHQKSIN